jgi:hypothetical protein
MLVDPSLEGSRSIAAATGRLQTSSRGAPTNEAAPAGDGEQVSRRLGHSDRSITSRIYAPAFEHAQRADERRSRLGALYPSGGSGVAAADGNGAQPTTTGATVIALA